jgi:hypothetical protein
VRRRWSNANGEEVKCGDDSMLQVGFAISSGVCSVVIFSLLVLVER